MSQQRYSDEPSAASTTATQHRTGRSNYGGGARTNRRGAANHNHPHGRGNPIENIGNWIQERRRRHRDRNHRPNGSAADANGRHDDHSGNHHPVGTEARALQNIRRNAKLFEYPADGFETPIEHSLLYAMIEFPMNYPESVVRKEIEEEDFEVYLYVNEKERRDSGTAADGGGVDTANASDAYIQSAKNTEQRRASYAQLSALLALSAEKNPSKSQTERNSTSSNDNSNKNNNNNDSNDIPSSSTNSLRLSEGTSHSTIHRSQDNTRNNNNNNTPPTIGQTLCKKLLKTITTYSTRHSLDRASEIRQFLSPVEKQCHLKNEKAALQQLLPAYLGYTISLVTGNPLPLLVGAASLMGKDPMQE
eukprot:CAMPEP_0171370572 /NCGR_PEP_ID=MMETSP0879-20121228/8110_1 /TAXON_ID=67004 /ORGANISM="Thalassiosira weissflogii, Strain CCMP1336" /LENGTH=361 /DNA_ID=CAMNT_0011879057 /DNA_START=43 /DNA_END=1125 /DNA_ORIENTATION=-